MILASPAVDANGTLYAASLDGKLYAISSSGLERWHLKTDDWIFSSPAIGADGTIYVGSDDAVLYAVGPGYRHRAAPTRPVRVSTRRIGGRRATISTVPTAPTR